MYLTYRELEVEFTKCVNNDDFEAAHVKADNLLKDVAIAASCGNLTTNEVRWLIRLFNLVKKHYA